MKSSAMRDLMALTERDDVISLAGGLPDTSTFPPDSYASLMSTVAASRARARSSTARPRGLRVVKRCIVEVMRGRGDGDRRRRAARDHGRPAGDRPRLQDAARPRRRRRVRGPDLSGRGPDVLRLSGRGRPGDDGSRRDAGRRARAHARRARALGPAPQVHLHRPELPQPGRRDAVARAPARARPDRRRARAARPRGQPVRAAPLRGHAAADAALARRANSSSTRARSRRSSRPASGSAGPRRRRRCSRR